MSKDRGKIQLIDKIAKPGFSPVGGELFARVTRADGSQFLEKLEHNATMLGGAQNMAAKLLGMEIANGLFTNTNEMTPYSVYELDKDSRMTLLEKDSQLTNERLLCGIAFGKEGSDSQSRDVIRRFEKGWSSDDLLPFLYYKKASDDNIVNNYNNGYFLRSVENGIVKYYGKRVPFKGYGQVIGGEKLASIGYPSDDLAGSTLSSEYIIECEIDITEEHFTDYFIYDQLNSFSRRISSFKVLAGKAVKVKTGTGDTTVVDFRDILVCNVVPMTTISLEKDEKITLVYRMYF